MSIFNFKALKQKALKIGVSATRFLSKQLDVRHLGPFGIVKQDIGLEMMGGNDVHTKVWVANWCARAISSMVADVPKYLERTKDGEIVDDDPKFQLYTGRCNPIYDGYMLQEVLQMNLIYMGDAFLRVIGLGNEPKGNPRELWPLLSGEVDVRFRNDLSMDISTEYTQGNLEDLVYYDAHEKKVYEREEIIHIREPNPRSHIRGLSWLQAAEKKLQLNQQMEKYKTKVFSHGQFTSFNIHTPDHLSQEQKDEYRRDFMEVYPGVENLGLPLMTYGGFEAKPLSWSPADLKILEADRYNAAAIATMMGMPPELMGYLIETKNVATYKTAKIQLLEFTVIPAAERLNRRISAELWPDGSHRIRVNKDNIPDFRKSSEELAQAFWLTPNQRLTAQGHPTSDDPRMDQLYFPGTLMPLDALFIDTGANKDDF